MRRREFITLLGGAAVAWPRAACAQQPSMPLIGVVDSAIESTVNSNRLLSFRRGLNDAEFVEGRNVRLEFRGAEAWPDQLPAVMADLVRRQVAVLLVNGQALPAAKAATSTVRVVFVIGVDPVQGGFVSNLKRPDGNITGVSFTSAPLNPKRLELLHELVPKPAVIALLWDQNILRSDAYLRETEAAARALGRQIVVVQAGTDREFDMAFPTLVQAKAGALFVGSGTFFASRRQQLVALAARHALPASYAGREPVVLGGLMSYGASTSDAYRRAGHYVGRILKGTKPGDLPIELPTKYELVFNLGTARTLKLEIPTRLRALAAEVIE